MIVGVRRGDRVLVAVSLCGVFSGLDERDLILEENLPFFRVGEDCIVFAEELTYAVDVLRIHSDIFDGVTDGLSVMRQVVPKMKEVLEEYGCSDRGRLWYGNLLLIKGGRMFSISSNFTVSEPDEFVTFENEQHLRGGIEAAQDLDGSEQILFAVRSCGRMKCANYFPLALFDVTHGTMRIVGA